MLFETESQARNFIKFNSQLILEEKGKAPVRCYYCTMCGGWHVTSNPNAELGERIDRNKTELISKFTKSQEDKDVLAEYEERLKQHLDEVNMRMVFGLLDAAKDELDVCSSIVDGIPNNPKFMQRQYTLSARVEKARRRITSLDVLFSLSKDEQINYIAQNFDKTTGSNMKNILESHGIVVSLLSAFEELKALPPGASRANALAKCKDMISSINCMSKDYIRNYLGIQMRKYKC